MLFKRALYKESSYEISLQLDEKCSRGISYSSQIVFFQLLHCTCFSGAICPLQVLGFVRVRAIALEVKESWKRSVSDCKMLENISGNRRREKSQMCSVYKEKGILRDQYPSVKVGEPSKTTYRCFSELCRAMYL